MKKKMKLSTMTVFFALLLGFAVMCIGTEQACAMEGDGERDDPYQISTYDELKEFAQIVNGTHPSIKQNKVACAILMNEIDATGNSDWEPIAKNESNRFSGSFDGRGYTIKGLSIHVDYSEPILGLFGYLAYHGSITNVGLVDNNLSSRYSNEGVQYFGGVVGYNDSGTISNCYNTGTVSGNSNVGGVAGINDDGTITNCYNTGTVSGDGDVGGVVGENGETITNCYNTGAVSGNGDVGGVIGYMGQSSSASNCYNTGNVSGNRYYGGIAGWNNYGTWIPL